jgi:hypothetical protein
MFKTLLEAYNQAVKSGDRATVTHVLNQLDQLAALSDKERAALEKARSQRVG